MKNRRIENLHIDLKVTFRLLAILLLLFAFYNGHCIKGTVIDDYGKIVPNATVKFVDQSDPTKSYVGFTNAMGYYDVDAPLINYKEGSKDFNLFDPYPNPATDGVVIPVNLMTTGNLAVYIYNTYGGRVATVANENYSSGLYQLIWNGHTDVHQRVAPGIYFIQVIFAGRFSCRKIILMENNGFAVTPYPMNDLLKRYEPYKIKYTVTITCDTLIEKYTLTDYEIMHSDSNDFIVQKHVPIPYKVIGDYLAIYNVDSNNYRKIFLKGINIADGVPGTYPSDLSVPDTTYRWWLDSIASVGFNCIRVYTLHRPQFYVEVERFNNLHPDKPLYLMQGIWLDEDTITNLHYNFYKYADGYDSDIKEVVDCVHGKKSIAPRYGRAYGDFTTSVSRWVIGYIAGREIYGAEVLANDSINSSHTNYNGATKNIVLPYGGTPTESWMAERLDHLVAYERTTYHQERPVSISSWPTLDSFPHPTQHFYHLGFDDTVSVNLNKLIMKNAPAGFFLTYHIYPYYPDFISGTPGYQQWSDSIGSCPYYHYISLLKKSYSYPLFVAEYGVPASWGNAHSAFAGFNDGQLDETQQGNMEVRMLKDIYYANCAGGCLFEWIDEFFKNKWVIEPTSCGIDRRRLWHNVVNPETTFGMIKFEEDPPTYNYWQDFIPPVSPSNTRISKVQNDYDNEFFYSKIYFDNFNSNDTLFIGYDTYNPNVGESAFPILQGLVSMTNRAEFLLKITKDSANLYVTQAYDTYWDVNHGEIARVYHSISTDGFPWVIVKWKTDQMDTAISYPGRLRSVTYPATPTSINAVVRYNDHVEIRMPWHILNFTDPSNTEVLDCKMCKGNDVVRPHSPPISQLSIDTLPKETAYSDGIALSILMGNSNTFSYVETGRYLWSPWGVDEGTNLYIPPSPLRVQMKKNYYIFKNLFSYYPFTAN